MHNLNVKIKGSGKLIVKRNGVVRAEKADDNMLLDGFYTKLMSGQPHLEMKAAIKVGMGSDPTVGGMTTLQSGLQPTSGLWPTAFLVPDGVAQIVNDKLVVKGYYHFTFNPGQIVGPLVEYGLDLSANTRPDLYAVDTRLVIMSGADLPFPLLVTDKDQVLISYKITLTIDLVQPSKTVDISYDGAIIPHQVKMNVSKVGDILEFLNLLGSKPNDDKVSVLVSSEKPQAPLVPFIPDNLINVGEAVIKSGTKGSYVPVTIGSELDVPEGIQTITFSDSWYQLVLSPPIVKLPQQKVSFTIGQGDYTVDTPSFWVPPYWRAIHPDLAIGHMGTTCPIYGVPNKYLDGIQFGIYSTNSNLGGMGPIAIPHEKIGFFPAVESNKLGAGYYVNFGINFDDRRYTNWTEFCLEYSAALEVTINSKVLKIALGVDGNGAPKGNVVTASGALGTEIPGMVVFDTAADNYDEGYYTGTGVAIPMFSTADKLYGVLDAVTLSEFYGLDLTDKTLKHALGAGEVKATLTHKTTLKQESVAAKLVSVGEISKNSGWAHNFAQNQYTATASYSPDGGNVTTQGNLQIAILKYNSGSNTAPGGNLKIAPGERVRIHIGLGNSVEPLLDSYDYYLVLSHAYFPNVSYTLMCKQVNGSLAWCFLEEDGGEKAEMEYIETVAGNVWDSSFYLDGWFKDEIAGYNNYPREYHGVATYGQFDFRVYARPKDPTKKPVVAVDKFDIKY